MTAAIPAAIAAFLDTATPPEWVDEACNRVPELLLDHANCELKAASTALGFLYRYPDRTRLAQRMSRLAREELRHFEQVRTLMEELQVPFERLTASRYAGSLRDVVREEEPYKASSAMAIIYMHANASVPLLPQRLAQYQALLNMMLAKKPENRLQSAAEIEGWL